MRTLFYALLAAFLLVGPTAQATQPIDPSPVTLRERVTQIARNLSNRVRGREVREQKLEERNAHDPDATSPAAAQGVQESDEKL